MIKEQEKNPLNTIKKNNKTKVIVYLKEKINNLLKLFPIFSTKKHKLVRNCYK